MSPTPVHMYAHIAAKGKDSDITVAWVLINQTKFENKSYI